MSKLLDLVPKFFRDGGLLEAYAEAAGSPFDNWRQVIASLPTFFVASAMPEARLDSMLQLFGIPLDGFYTAEMKRALLSRAFEIWKNKGTETGIELYLSAVTGEVIAVNRLNRTAFISGVNLAGDICGIQGAPAWTFSITVPSSVTIPETKLRELLSLVVACYEEYTFV